MKKTSVAILFALSAITGIASAQDVGNGIQMSKDPARAAEIEAHARTVRLQPAVEQSDVSPDTARAMTQPRKHDRHSHKGKFASWKKKSWHRTHTNA